MPKPPSILSPKDPFFGLRILQPNEDPSLPPKRILNYKDGTELVYIPPGPFWMGDDELDKKWKDCPRHEVYLDGFYMAAYPVTNKQYRRFMWETGHRVPDGVWCDEERGKQVGKQVWKGNRLLPGYEEHPVVCVDWEDSVAYGRWANLRLPTEAEWEKAAGGPAGLKYPWGHEWDGNRCRHYLTSGAEATAEVEAYPSGRSVYGCEQMSGNVLEWCEDWYARDVCTATERRNPRGPGTGSSRVNRGCSFGGGALERRVAFRVRVDPYGRGGKQGFRVARSFP